LIDFTRDGGAEPGIINVYLSNRVRGCGTAYFDCQDKACLFIVASTKCSPLLFTKQVGMLMGAGADPENQAGTRWPYGYGRIVERVNFTQTVMGGQLNAPRLPYFSNPNIWWKGFVLGVKGRQDNSRVLNMRRYEFLQY